MNRFVCAITATLLAAGPALAQSPSVERTRLTAMTGTWDIEMTLWTQPGRPGLLAKGTSTISSSSTDSFSTKSSTPP
ncbi:MAG TPA: hypothetical protein VIV65_02835 [Gemmatimonadaceae bacterium]